MSEKTTKPEKKDKAEAQSRKTKAEDLRPGAKGKNVKGGGGKGGLSGDV